MTPLTQQAAEREAAVRLGEVSASVRARNPHLFPPQAAAPKPGATPGTRLKQNHRKRPQSEIRAEALLKQQWPHADIRWQAVTLVLANGLRYTPDAFALPGGGIERATAWEVKGPHAWDDAIAKLKMAAAAWPAIRFVLLWQDPDKHWREQVIEGLK